MLKLNRPLAIMLACAVILPAAGCARNRTQTDVPFVARELNSLYLDAKRNLDRGRYEEAAKLFAEVERQHPYSIWARRAQLMSAYSYYVARKYSDAVSAAQRFLTIHPGNRDAPYAHYVIGMSYFQQIEDITRDQRITQQAKDAFGELIRRYPDTRYAADARVRVGLLDDHLAGKEMEVGRFYQRQGKWLAATLRFRNVIDDYQATRHAPEALHRLVESYLALGIPEEAQKAAAALAANHADSPWHQRSHALIQRHAPRG